MLALPEKTMTSRPARRILFPVACASCFAAPVHALTTTWTRGAGTGFFANTNNWSAGKPSAILDAIFPDPVPGSVGQILVTGAESANSLTFNNAYLLDGGVTVGPSLTLTTRAVAVNTAATVTAHLAVLVLGSNGLTKSGGGILSLDRQNTFSGSVT